NVSVSAEEPGADMAATMLAGWTSAVRKFFRAERVHADELTVQPIATEAVTAEDTGADATGILGYKLTRTFQIRSSRVPAIRAVAEHTSKLLRANVPLQSEPPQYIYTKLPSLRPALLARAARDAKRRAESLLDATGGHLGGLRGVDVGVFQVTSPNSTEVS